MRALLLITTVLLSVPDDAEPAPPRRGGPRVLVVADDVQITAAGGAAMDRFGWSVAIARDGSRAIVGVRNDDGSATDTGSARVFVRSGTAWIEEAALVAPDAAMGDRLGHSVAISMDGSVALVGVPGDDTAAGTDAGSVRVFVRTGTSWAQEAALTGMPARAMDGVGAAVAVSDDGRTALIGAPDALGAGGMQTGAAHVYVRGATAWAHEAALLPAGGGSGDSFGAAVALSADGATALVGAPPLVSLEAGYARVFFRSAGLWSEQASLTVPASSFGDRLGAAVALSADGSRALLGAPGDATAASNAGAVYPFGRTGTTWTGEPRIVAADAAANDGFGTSVALSASGAVALVGAPGDDVPAADRGSVRVLRAASGWAEELALTASDGAATDEFGWAVAVSGDGLRLVASARFDTTSGGADAGSARIFTLVETLPDGAACTGPGLCDSGHCVDGVCCATACAGGAGDCQACSIAGGGTLDGTCTALAVAGAVCRAAAGGCDVPETCSTGSTACPADAVRAPGTECRPSAGTCDVAEVCDGVAQACPGDAFLPAGSVCGTGVGDCALPTTCPGGVAACPATAGVRPVGTLCRAAVSACDLDDFCDGTTALCDDAFAPVTQPCGGPAAGDCDAPDHCSGTSGDCEAEFLSGVECRPSAGACDPAEVCLGDATSCPPDLVAPSGMVCRPSTVACDPDETCDGTGASCPADVSSCADDGGLPVDGGARDAAVPADAPAADSGAPTVTSAGCACRARASSTPGGLALFALALALAGRRLRSR